MSARKQKNWPVWYTEADEAEADAITGKMVDDLYDHRESCESCQASEPCPAFQKIVATAQRAIRAVGDFAFATYTRDVQRRYQQQ